MTNRTFTASLLRLCLACIAFALGLGAAQAGTSKVSADLLAVVNAPAGSALSVAWARRLPGGKGLHVQVLMRKALRLKGMQRGSGRPCSLHQIYA